MWKIQSYEVCEFCVLLHYARKSVTTFRKVANNSQRTKVGKELNVDRKMPKLQLNINPGLLKVTPVETKT